MNQKDNDEYFVLFKGAKLNRNQATQTGFGIIAGLIGFALCLIIFGTNHKLYSLILITIFAGIGFFGHGYVKEIKKSRKT